MRLRPRHIKRYRKIAEILADHGFGAFLKQLGLSERLNLPRWFLRRRPYIAKLFRQFMLPSTWARL